MKPSKKIYVIIDEFAQAPDLSYHVFTNKKQAKRYLRQEIDDGMFVHGVYTYVLKEEKKK